jgi:hypothetical protein
MEMKARAVDQETYDKAAKKETVTPPTEPHLEPLTYRVTRQYGKKPNIEEEQEEEEIEVRGFVVEPARVGVELSRTMNFGHGTFESARVGVTISVPCYREEIADAYAYAKEFAAERIGDQVSRIRKHLEEKYNRGD